MTKIEKKLEDRIAWNAGWMRLSRDLKMEAYEEIRKGNFEGQKIWETRLEESIGIAYELLGKFTPVVYTGKEKGFRWAKKILDTVPEEERLD